MKRKIFDLLMEIKAEVLKSLKPPEAEIVSSEIQVSPGSEMPIVDDVVFATLEEDEPKAISFDGKTNSNNRKMVLTLAQPAVYLQ